MHPACETVRRYGENPRELYQHQLGSKRPKRTKINHVTTSQSHDTHQTPSKLRQSRAVDGEVATVSMVAAEEAAAAALVVGKSAAAASAQSLSQDLTGLLRQIRQTTAAGGSAPPTSTNGNTDRGIRSRNRAISPSSRILSPSSSSSDDEGEGGARRRSSASPAPGHGTATLAWAAVGDSGAKQRSPVGSSPEGGEGGESSSVARRRSAVNTTRSPTHSDDGDGTPRLIPRRR
jgi:hypothetical protein